MPARDMNDNAGHRWSPIPWGIAGAVLSLPALLMLLSEEMNWGPADFAILGGLLFGACGAYEFARRRTASPAYRAATAVAAVGALFLIWVNLAVGIIGSEDNPANLLFANVLAAGAAGAFACGGHPAGMARAMTAVAVVQVIVGLLAAASGMASDSAGGSGPVLGLTVMFASAWLLSAWLYHRASKAAA